MIRNFLFHRVSIERDRLWDPMDVALFEKCIKHILNKYDVVLLEDLVFSENLFSKNKYATIMFDDGYKDNMQYALPILDKYKCKASFYVVTDCIDNNSPTWTHKLEYLFQNTNINDINIDFDFLPIEFHLKQLNSKEDRIKYVSRLKPYLKTIPHSNRNEVLKRIVESYTDVEMPKLMMNWTDLRELRHEGHNIGSHTVSHSMLGTNDNEQEVMAELVDSRLKIKNEIGTDPLTISYPVGSFNYKTKELSKQSGYKIGLAVKQDVYKPDVDDLFEIPRIELYNEPWWKTKLRISNALEDIKKMIKYR